MKKKWLMLFIILVTLGMMHAVSAALLHQASGRVVHYNLYITDGYVNTGAGMWPAVVPPVDYTLIAGWPKPLYIWGFTDVDPNIPGNLMTVPVGAVAPKGGPVGNAKFPGPFLEVAEGDDVYITVHNRGFYQKLQKVQDDHSLHLHGIHAQAQYDGFPESAGGYSEQIWYFWEEGWYKNCDGNTIFCTGILPNTNTTKMADTWWNSLPIGDPQTRYTQAYYLSLSTRLPLKNNLLNAAGGIPSQFNLAPWPLGVGAPLPTQPSGAAMNVEDVTQFTYYFRAEHTGTYMYHCHVAASEHVQMGMYGALIIRPRDGGAGLGNIVMDHVYGDVALDNVGIQNLDHDNFTKEYTFLVSEIDPNWHAIIEAGKRKAFYPPNWKPELWFINGRTFPQTLLPFAWNIPNPTIAVPNDPEPRYNTYISVQPGERFLIRWINMGYQEHPMHQHGWHMAVIGSDARPFYNLEQKYTLLIGSGETYDAITTADPVYGYVDGTGLPQGPRLGNETVPSSWKLNPLSYPCPLPNNLCTPPAECTAGFTNIRQVYPIHDHDDYRVTTNGIYPGGALVLMEAKGVVCAQSPTWVDPYVPPPGIQNVPVAP